MYQGRNIGISALIALNADEILVLERDNRGIGGDPSLILNQTPAAHKRIYKVDRRCGHALGITWCTLAPWMQSP